MARAGRAEAGGPSRESDEGRDASNDAVLIEGVDSTPRMTRAKLCCTPLPWSALTGSSGSGRRRRQTGRQNAQGRTPCDEALRGMANVDGADQRPASDTAALLADLMEKQGGPCRP